MDAPDPPALPGGEEALPFELEIRRPETLSPFALPEPLAFEVCTTTPVEFPKGPAMEVEVVAPCELLCKLPPKVEGPCPFVLTVMVSPSDCELGPPDPAPTLPSVWAGSSSLKYTVARARRGVLAGLFKVGPAPTAGCFPSPGQQSHRSDLLFS